MIGLLLTNQNAESLAEAAASVDGDSAVLFSAPGIGVYEEALRQLPQVKQPAGLSIEARRLHALEHLRDEFPQSNSFRLIDGHAAANWSRESIARAAAASVHIPLTPTVNTPLTLPTSDVDLLRPVPASRWQILVKSFKRHDCLLRFIESVRWHYPDVEILVADDSFQPGEPETPLVAHIRTLPGVRWFSLPFDSGVTRGRRHLFEQARAEYVVLCDDDFVFAPDTRIEALIDVLDSDPDLDLVAGLVRWHGVTADNYNGTYVARNGGIEIEPLQTPWETTRRGVSYRRSDLTFNFYAARRETLLEADPWDDRFTICYEHMDFFLNCWKLCVHCAYTPAAVVGHLKDLSDEYRRFRARGNDFAPLLMEKHGLDELPRTHHQAEPGVPRFDVAAWLDQVRRQSRPNIIIFGVGHSGTSILTRMLLALGWHCPPADEEFCEHVPIRDLNTQILRGEETAFQAAGRMPAGPTAFQAEARRLIDELPEPWVIKDPRFVHTIGRWLPTFQASQPLLLWITRDPAEVAASFRRRGEGGSGPEVVTRGLTLTEARQEAARIYRLWPWPKFHLPYEQLRDVVAAFDLNRQTSHA